MEDNFEDWDTLDTEEVELLFNEDEMESDLEDGESELESESENDSEDDQALKCSKCSKIYHVIGWLKKDKASCGGKENKSKSTKGRKELSQHQKHVREILGSLGFDEYYVCTGDLI